MKNIFKSIMDKKSILIGAVSILLTIDYTWASCPGDFDESGLVEVSDVLNLLAYFGCYQDCVEYDLDGDDAVGTNDVLMVLGYFGQNCEQTNPSVWSNSPLKFCSRTMWYMGRV